MPSLQEQALQVTSHLGQITVRAKQAYDRALRAVGDDVAHLRGGRVVSVREAIEAHRLVFLVTDADPALLRADAQSRTVAAGQTAALYLIGSSGTYVPEGRSGPAGSHYFKLALFELANQALTQPGEADRFVRTLLRHEVEILDSGIYEEEVEDERILNEGSAKILAFYHQQQQPAPTRVSQIAVSVSQPAVSVPEFVVPGLAEATDLKALRELAIAALLARRWNTAEGQVEVGLTPTRTRRSYLGAKPGTFWLSRAVRNPIEMLIELRMGLERNGWPLTPEEQARLEQLTAAFRHRMGHPCHTGNGPHTPHRRIMTYKNTQGHKSPHVKSIPHI